VTFLAPLRELRRELPDPARHRLRRVLQRLHVTLVGDHDLDAGIGAGQQVLPSLAGLDRVISFGTGNTCRRHKQNCQKRKLACHPDPSRCDASSVAGYRTPGSDQNSQPWQIVTGAAAGSWESETAPVLAITAA
jgi:hypothetical protein